MTHNNLARVRSGGRAAIAGQAKERASVVPLADDAGALLAIASLREDVIGDVVGLKDERVLNDPRQGTAALGLGGNAASVIVPRRRSSASLSARSSFSSGGT